MNRGDPESRFRSDAWLAGFSDGEACFHLALKRNKRSVGYVVSGIQPRFDLKLRADDVGILEELRGAFGGTLKYEDQRGEGNRKPRYAWSVTAKRELLALVEYFDVFPLRAKKQRDFVIWRRAVFAYVTKGPRAEELPALREALMVGRLFGSDGDELLASDFDPQITLTAERGWLDGDE